MQIIKREIDESMSAVDNTEQDVICVESAKDPNAGLIRRLRHKPGTASYADLISTAILSENPAQMTVAEIYDWMATNVEGLNEQRFLHSSKGWKNAVRHTLSINKRFTKIVRVGRPCLWTVDNDSAPTSFSRKVSFSNMVSSNGVDRGTKDSKNFRQRASTEPCYTLKSKVSTIKKPSIKSEFGFACSKEGSVQNVNVYHDDGTSETFVIPKPLMLKCQMSTDVGTQTEDFQLFESTGSVGSTSGTDIYDCYSLEVAPTVNDSFFALMPEDLIDIRLDPLLSFGDLHFDDDDDVFAESTYISV